MANQIVWQDHNPFPKVSRFDEVPEFVFIEKATGADEPFSEASPITSRLQRMLFPFPGSISELNVSTMDFTPLVRTGPESGTVLHGDMIYRPLGPFGPSDVNPRRKHVAGVGDYMLAARITGTPPKAEPAGFADLLEEEADDEGGKAINVVLVADIDMLTEAFFRLREQGEIPGAGLHFDFDNVTFVLNLLDELAGDDRFIELRKRRPLHRPLTRIDQLMEEARKETRKARREQQDRVDEAEKKEQDILDDEIKKLREDMQKRAMGDAEIANRIGMKQKAGQRRLNDMVEELKQDRDKKIDEIGTKLKNEVRQLQDRYKLMAVGLPPLLPLALALIVLLTRRSRERKGVSRTRLRP
jgi:ABC-2 type transport system permease protein